MAHARRLIAALDAEQAAGAPSSRKLIVKVNQVLAHSQVEGRAQALLESKYGGAAAEIRRWPRWREAQEMS